MAAQKNSYGPLKTRKPKKRQSRTEVSSSSESDSESDVSSQKSSEDVVGQKASPVLAPAKKPKLAKPTQDVSMEPEESPAPPVKKSKKKAKSAPTNEDIDMIDAPAPAPTSVSKMSKPKEDFSAIYLRKIAAEVADDLDKVREAQDFKANSVPMLIHALRQGESMFSVEEKRRVVGAAQ